jgi:hypothetical protein
VTASQTRTPRVARLRGSTGAGQGCAVILGEIFEGAKVVQVLEVEPIGKVWSAMIDEARTDENMLPTKL